MQLCTSIGGARVWQFGFGSISTKRQKEDYLFWERYLVFQVDVLLIYAVTCLCASNIQRFLIIVLAFSIFEATIMESVDSVRNCSDIMTSMIAAAFTVINSIYVDLGREHFDKLQSNVSQTLSITFRSFVSLLSKIFDFHEFSVFSRLQ